ncbi:acetyltransferase [Altererythrobacter sp. Root672]|uniref:acetyltransferase n=1 Tax=Altererythrobacter sp. Root672 TaxID=1736584 RepID=UPI0006F2437A|nr:acetyltransferase [Altererythrobacter sp. Root672]KRA80378.1 acetyltransferase [Altererythrobacter sp. Root672]
MSIRFGVPADVSRALEIWRDATDATHEFLTPEHRVEIDAMFAGWLPEAELWLALDEREQTVGFLAMDGDMIDALFVDPAVHGQGYGTKLVNHALTMAPNATVDASEQASNALPFYESLGFVRTGGSATDSQGRPYPLVYLAYAGKP